ncbi:MAG: hypothetical protein ACYC5G_01920 [Candidatus Doudnabacteria bacterium]
MSTPEQLIPESERRTGSAFETVERQGTSVIPGPEQVATPEIPPVTTGEVPVVSVVEQTPEQIQANQESVRVNTAVPDFLAGKLTAGQLLEKKNTGELSAADLVNGLINRQE